MMSPTPYLSVVGWLRNDGYTDRYLDRIRHSICFLVDQFERFAIRTELVIVEWNPPADRPLIADLIALPRESRFVTTRFIFVDGRHHAGLVGSDLKGMHVLNAANAAIRRAAGQFIVPKALDTYLTDPVIEQIAQRRLRDDEAYRCDRFDVEIGREPASVEDRQELLKLMEANIVRHHSRIQQTPNWAIRDLHTNACGDFTLMSATAWHKIRGYQDDRTVLCLDADSIALHAAAAHGIREVCWPDNCRIYKITHDHIFAQRVTQEFEPWQTYLDRFAGKHLSGSTATALRIWLDYPKRRIRGLESIVGPSIERNFVSKARRYAQGDTSLETNHADWGLARETFPERVVQRAQWDARKFL